MELTKIQRRLLRLLKENENTPLTVREIQEQLDLSSPSLVHHHILQLEKKKFLKRNPDNPKDYKILNDPDTLLSYVNLYGMAKCGPDGTLLSGDPIDRIPLSPKIISFNIEDAFLVKASGDSMEPEIHDGDLIIGKNQRLADNRDIVICTKDGLVMVKKFFKDENTVMLISINEEYKPIAVNQDSNFVIEGIVKGVICTHK
jgi:repressor LexA